MNTPTSTLAKINSVDANNTVRQEMLKELKFDPKKPFFGLVYTYLCALHGNLELCSRWLATTSRKVAERPGAVDALIAKIDRKTTKERMPAIARGNVTIMLDDLALDSKAEGRPIRPDVDELAVTAVHEHSLVLESFITQAASSLLILAWDTTVGSHTREPEWEFLRHCRNAAAHNGRFHFLNDEPRRPAVWRKFEIRKELETRSLFRVSDGGAFLGPGDALLLLADLEKKLK